ncbi:unnamed protein product, partial [Brenthis ino]
MANLCDKIKSDSSLDENPVKKLKLSDDTDLSKDKRTVATMCGAWRPEEEDGGLIFVFKTRTPALSPDPTKECDYPENIEDFWEGSFVNTDIIQAFYLRFGSAPSLKVKRNFVVYWKKGQATSMWFNLYDVLLADSGHGGHLNEISQLRRRYYSAQVYAQIQVHSLFLSLSYSGGTTTRHDR